MDKSKLILMSVMGIIIILLAGNLIVMLSSEDYEPTHEHDDYEPTEEREDIPLVEEEIEEEWPGLVDSVENIIDDCLETSSFENRKMFIKAQVKNDISLCNEARDSESCRMDYYLYITGKVVNPEFEESCAEIQNNEVREFCEAIKNEDIDRCSYMGEQGKMCRAIIEDDKSICKEIQGEEKLTCKIAYIYSKAFRNNDESYCEMFNEISFSRDNYPELSDKRFINRLSQIAMQEQKAECKALVNQELRYYEEFVEETCYLHHVATLSKPSLCEVTNEQYKNKCTEMSEELVHCVDENSEYKTIKECIDNFTFIEVFCKDHYGKDEDEVLGKIPELRNPKEKIIKNNPGVCVI